jgi:hypothetical protein
MSQTTKPIPVRMKKPLADRVEKGARRLGVTRCDVIRLGLLTILPQIESGTIQVPKSPAA